MKRVMPAVLILISSLFSFSCYAADYSATIKKFKNSKQTHSFFKSAYGYALFPTIGKGGFGIGAAHGEGQVYRKGKVTGKTSMTQVTIGLQAGGQAYSQIIFFKDKRAYNDFTSGNFEFGAQATAVAITAGAQASSGTTGTTAGASAGGGSGAQSKVDYHKGMATFTFAKGGFMYEASLGGQTYSFTPNK